MLRRVLLEIVPFGYVSLAGVRMKQQVNPAPQVVLTSPKGPWTQIDSNMLRLFFNLARPEQKSTGAGSMVGAGRVCVLMSLFGCAGHPASARQYPFKYMQALNHRS